jgi:L,D-transpeptidase catalytic domain
MPIFVGCLSVSFTWIPSNQTAFTESTGLSVIPVINDSVEKISPNTPLNIYHATQLGRFGLSPEAFLTAWKGYRYLQSKNKISKQQYLTICDFSQPSDQKRLYMIDVENEELVINTYVAHGRNSGSNLATRFSNKPESLQSSLGFYITRNTYTGKHGLSLRLEGVDPGYNDKAMERAIVIHGAAYVDPSRAKAGVMMGRSWGCPAVPEKESALIISTIQNGTCLFIYHPQKEYLHGSKLLND